MSYDEDVATMAANARKAHEEGTYDSLCLYGEPVFYVPGSYGVEAGHIYSEAGVAEFKISKCCEFHFDEMFADDE